MVSNFEPSSPVLDTGDVLFLPYWAGTGIGFKTNFWLVQGKYIFLLCMYMFFDIEVTREYIIYTFDVKSTVNLKCRQYISAAVFLFSLSAFSLIHISSKTIGWCPNTFGPANYAHLGCVMECAQFRSLNVSGQQQYVSGFSLDTFKLGNWVGTRKEMQQDFCLACI